MPPIPVIKGHSPLARHADPFQFAENDSNPIKSIILIGLWGREKSVGSGRFCPAGGFGGDVTVGGWRSGHGGILGKDGRNGALAIANGGLLVVASQVDLNPPNPGGNRVTRFRDAQ